MPFLILKSNLSVWLDDEDVELTEQHSWHLCKLQPSQKPSAAAQQKRYARMFRLMLHREVAFRMKPDLVKQSFRVFPRNGDYLDCRRGNLEIVLPKDRRGKHRAIDPRPVGWERYPPKVLGDRPPASPAWAGGFVYKAINRDHLGEGYRVRKLLAGKPID
jgi:hypothetical protein